MHRLYLSFRGNPQKLIQDGVKEWTPLMKKLMALEVEEEDNPVLMLMSQSLKKL